MSKAGLTRQNILQKAFTLIYRKGFQATSIDEIIATTQVTKGAFFYHFKNKEEMGLAIINEVMYPSMYPYMISTLEGPGNIPDKIYNMIKNLLQAPFFEVEHGCPTVNLIEEMAPLNEAFKSALQKLVKEWQKAIEIAIEKAQAKGEIDTQHDAKMIALYITINYNGIRNMGKVLGRTCYGKFLQEFKKYLSALK
ncbi:TetR/AcrR family transcriptional regulator [Desertivirga brevis]|uniref:TetR/AcrR family transcriptional regulator n=1 Tax=Desertivirga brevis TaxID=2810310 RepID=UPI001A9568DD|nr:TetR/AcrR family transcriptional regulator [Pedobacter sp. SYSU D00873]